MKKNSLIFIIAIVLLAAASRLMKHPPNFTPIAAIGLFAGFYFRSKWGIVIPLAAMFIGDIFIGLYDWRLMAAVYISIAIMYFIGMYANHNNTGNWRKVLGGSLLGSVIFFIMTNFAAWALYSWYPHNLSGLLNCFSMALPFFRNSLLGDLSYTVALFGVYEFAHYFLAQKQAKLLRI